MSTITDPIMLDSTGQAIKNSIDLLAANINRTASNIPYDNNLTIKGKIDEIDAKTADDIPYSSGVSVKDKLDWVLAYQDLTFDSNRVDVSAYSELFVVPKLQGYARSYPTFMLRLPSFDIATAGAEYSGSAVTNFIMYGINIDSSNTLKLRGTLRGWSTVTFDIYGRK